MEDGGRVLLGLLKEILSEDASSIARGEFARHLPVSA
jgi:hypothetical protein